MKEAVCHETTTVQTRIVNEMFVGVTRLATFLNEGMKLENFMLVALKESQLIYCQIFKLFQLLCSVDPNTLKLVG